MAPEYAVSEGQRSIPTPQAAMDQNGVQSGQKLLVEPGHDFDADVTLGINEEYAKRFEHNMKREELQRLQEKYGTSHTASKTQDRKKAEQSEVSSTEESSDSEVEDDEGVLASVALDAEIQQTMEAIRKKDPRVYDHKFSFYKDSTGEHGDTLEQSPPAKPMYLSDYHRQNLLNGSSEPSATQPATESYAVEQANLQKNIRNELFNTLPLQDNEVVDGDTSDFLIAKTKAPADTNDKAQAGPVLHDSDVQNADQDPEAYLSKFMATRGWLSDGRAQLQPFDSDDEEEDNRADEFEEAYNMRFEDPHKANEKLVSHARDIVAKHSVRKESSNPRKKARNMERDKLESAKRTRHEEKARLRKLKISDAEEKILRIKDAAGSAGIELDKEEWADFLENDWDDEKWEEEMKKRFSDAYYAEQEESLELDKAGEKRKPKKPKWDQDIDITDIDPDSTQNPEANAPSLGTENRETEDAKPLGKINGAQRKTAQQQRQEVEHFVDEQMQIDNTLANFGKRHGGNFRYRETSPLSFGLTAQDILTASDSQLNQFVGLKKMASFRDPEKKQKDKKKLGKKARLRQWRKETFGEEKEAQQGDASNAGLLRTSPSNEAARGNGDQENNTIRSKSGRTRKRRKTFKA